MSYITLGYPKGNCNLLLNSLYGVIFKFLYQNRMVAMDNEIRSFLDNLSADGEDLKSLVGDLIIQLEDSYYAFYQLLSFVPGSFMLISASGNILAASHRMKRVFLQTDDISNKKYYQIKYPFFADNSQEKLITDLIKQSLMKGLSFENILIECENSIKDNVFVELNLQVLRCGNGEINSVLMTLVEDIVKLDLLPGNMEKDQKLKKSGSLATGLVHEIKNPMQSITAIAQLIQYKYPDDKFLQKYLDSAMTEINRVNVILSEFLTFSGGNQEYMSYTHINEICNDVLQIIYGNCFMNEIDVKTNLSDDIPKMIMDIGRMKQVLVNFITNSIDAINTLRHSDDFESNYPDYQGIIEISTSYNYELNECYVSVRDNGIGMTEDTMKEISKPFYTTKNYGTGIGVYISKNIIKNHGGRLEIKSKYGEGSEFIVILPELAGLMELAVKQSDHNSDNTITVTRLNECIKEDYYD